MTAPGGSDLDKVGFDAKRSLDMHLSFSPCRTHGPMACSLTNRCAEATLTVWFLPGSCLSSSSAPTSWTPRSRTGGGLRLLQFTWFSLACKWEDVVFRDPFWGSTGKQPHAMPFNSMLP